MNHFLTIFSMISVRRYIVKTLSTGTANIHDYWYPILCPYDISTYR